MTEFSFHLYTTRDISNSVSAEVFLNILENYNIIPEKINNNMPINIEYSRKKAIELWTVAGGQEPDFRLGMFFGKINKPGFSFSIRWNIGEKSIPNSFIFYFNKSTLNNHYSLIENIFKELIMKFDCIYGYITNSNKKNNQYVVGGIEERIDGIFWCNFFGKIFVNFFGKNKLINGPWQKVEELENGGVIVFLKSDLLDKKHINSFEEEDKVKKYLGEDSFGDFELYSHNLEIQYKNVPKLDLSELKKPLSSFKI